MNDSIQYYKRDGEGVFARKLDRLFLKLGVNASDEFLQAVIDACKDVFSDDVSSVTIHVTTEDLHPEVRRRQNAEFKTFDAQEFRRPRVFGKECQMDVYLKPENEVQIRLSMQEDGGKLIAAYYLVRRDGLTFNGHGWYQGFVDPRFTYYVKAVDEAVSTAKELGLQVVPS